MKTARYLLADIEKESHKQYPTANMITPVATAHTVVFRGISTFSCPEEPLSIMVYWSDKDVTRSMIPPIHKKIPTLSRLRIYWLSAGVDGDDCVLSILINLMII